MSATAPILDSNIDNRSPWFAAGYLPVHVGWYECRRWSDVLRKWLQPSTLYWDGAGWLYGPDCEASEFGRHAMDQWRGRAAP